MTRAGSFEFHLVLDGFGDLERQWDSGDSEEGP